jgi:heme exporter protein A
VTASLLALEAVDCRRGGRMLFTALTFQLSPGEAMLVTGPNGCGKSSLLRLAAGLLAPGAGRIVRGAPAALADEGLALDREQPLGRALAIWARLDGAAERLPGAMAALGLDGLFDVPVRLLSTGQARRARLARVAASGAPLWLLDEPLNGLDAAGAGQLGALLAKHRASGGAVLAASHQALPGADWQTLELAR